MNRLDQGLQRHWPASVGRVDGDDGGARRREPLDIRLQRGDPHRVFGQGSFDDTDDRHGQPFGGGRHAVDTFQPDALRTAIDGRLRHADHEIGAVQRTACDRLARHHQLLV